MVCMSFAQLACCGLLKIKYFDHIFYHLADHLYGIKVIKKKSFFSALTKTQLVPFEAHDKIKNDAISNSARSLPARATRPHVHGHRINALAMR